LSQQAAPAATVQGENPLDAILAALGGNAAAVQQPIAPPPPPQYQQPAAPAPPPASDVSALIAQLYQNAQTGGVTTPVNPYQGYSMPPSVGGQDQGHDGYYGSSSYASSDQYSGNANGNDHQSSGANNGGGKRKWQGNSNKKYTHPCRFWKEGKCKKGDACTFKHD
jgi:hypothetical protein